MDAMKFIKERNRMCKTNVSCYNCPAHEIGCSNSCKFAMENWLSPEQQIQIVEEWSAIHPRKTRQSVFLERYPNAELDSQGILCICPESIYGEAVCSKKTENCRIICYDCRHEFWTQEVEE